MRTVAWLENVEYKRAADLGIQLSFLLPAIRVRLYLILAAPRRSDVVFHHKTIYRVSFLT